MSQALKIRNFSKYYGAHVAVDGLTLDIQEGEFFGLLGPNGAGKSTTINSICGINRVDEGSIEVYGHDVKADPLSAKRLIGLAPQDYNVDIFLTVYNMLMYVGGYYGIPRKERKKRALHILKMLNLHEHSRKRFQHLSGGMKRRAMLARALICDPKLMILDEPTAGLDLELRYELWDHLKKLHKQKKTIILTSHYIEEIQRLCERVAIIDKGKLLFVGHKDELLEKHASLEEAYMSYLKHAD